jgi:hypothetical protein
MSNTGYKDSSNNDLFSLFGSRIDIDIGYNTGFKNSSGTDFRYLFLPLSKGINIDKNTGFIDSSGKDLSQVFGKAIPSITLYLSFQLQGRPGNYGPNTTRVTLTGDGTTYYTRDITPSTGTWTTYTDTITNVPKIELKLQFQNTNSSTDKSNALYNVSLTNSSTGTQYISNGNFTSPTSFDSFFYYGDNGNIYYTTSYTPNFDDLYYPESETNTPLSNWSGRYVILGKDQYWGYTNSPAPTQFVSLQMGSDNNGIIYQTFTPS